MATHSYNLIYILDYILNIFQNDANPTWKPVRITSGKLCNGDWDRTLKFEIFDHDGNGEHDYIGEYYTTLDEVRIAI